jgi:hypothetical protein
MLRRHVALRAPGPSAGILGAIAPLARQVMMLVSGPATAWADTAPKISRANRVSGGVRVFGRESHTLGTLPHFLE